MRITREEFFKRYQRLSRLMTTEEILAGLLWHLQRQHLHNFLAEIEDHAKAYRKFKEKQEQ